MRRRYDKAGILALYPQAFWDLFVEVDKPDVSTVDGNAVIEIRGPLEHHDDWWCDSYEAILDRVAEACASEARTVVLKIDSPGGELFGCFDAARAIRARCKAAGKRLVAYVEGCACSAAYALACSAEQIIISETAFAGSIGILITRVDLTARDAHTGIGFALVASGKRKLDGNPHASLTTAELESMQSQCDSLAELFFELVASLRGVSTDAVRALEAGVFHGPRAVEVGLADRVASFDEAIELLTNDGGIMATAKKENEETETPTPSSSQKDVDDARAALERAAADGDEKAQAALDVLNGEAKAEEPADEEEEDGETNAAASAPRRNARSSSGVSADSAAGLARIVAQQGKRLEALEREKEGLERTALLNSRPDLGKELVEHLATMPYAEAKKIVDRIPKPEQVSKTAKAATASVAATRGENEGTGIGGGSAPGSDGDEFDRAFGIDRRDSKAVRREGSTLVFDPAAQIRALNRKTNTAAPVAEEGK